MLSLNTTHAISHINVSPIINLSVWNRNYSSSHLRKLSYRNTTITTFFFYFFLFSGGSLPKGLWRKCQIVTTSLLSSHITISHQNMRFVLSCFFFFGIFFFGHWLQVNTSRFQPIAASEIANWVLTFFNIVKSQE